MTIVRGVSYQHNLLINELVTFGDIVILFLVVVGKWKKWGGW